MQITLDESSEDYPSRLSIRIAVYDKANIWMLGVLFGRLMTLSPSSEFKWGSVDDASEGKFIRIPLFTDRLLEHGGHDKAKAIHDEGRNEGYNAGLNTAIRLASEIMDASPEHETLIAALSTSMKKCNK